MPWLLLSLILPAGAAAAAGAAGTDVSLEVSGIRHAFDVGPRETIARGGLAGLAARHAPTPRLRLSGRALLGYLDYEAGGREETGAATLFEGELTWGPVLDDGVRVYGGIGVQRFARHDQFAAGDGVSADLYLPFGVSAEGAFVRGWRARTAVELQLFPHGRERVRIGGERVTFERHEGVGFHFSAVFRQPRSRLRIEPFLRYVDAGDSETEVVGGRARRLEDVDRTEAGLRVGWAF